MLKRKLYRALALICFLFFAIVKIPSQDLRLNLVKDSSLIPADTSVSVEALSVSLPSITLNKKANVFVKKYLKEYDRTLIVAKQRSESVFGIMDSVFTRFDIPVQLKYMAVVESNLRSSARSHVGAGGMWQLMPFTAGIYGLKHSRKNDERFHVYKSTIAAARYIKELYEEFGDWLLVVAAYNSGSARVHYAIRHSGSRDFWRLQNFLPLETRNHVKRFIGVHYYFEGQGSMATMTKAETILYKKTIAELIANNSESKLANKDVVIEPN